MEIVFMIILILWTLSKSFLLKDLMRLMIRLEVDQTSKLSLKQWKLFQLKKNKFLKIFKISESSILLLSSTKTLRLSQMIVLLSSNKTPMSTLTMVLMDNSKVTKQVATQVSAKNSWTAKRWKEQSANLLHLNNSLNIHLKMSNNQRLRKISKSK